jgi:UDP-GlcNAc:undecaprenyl-phosphate GlcNAc-1-phosphate transferase
MLAAFLVSVTFSPMVACAARAFGLVDTPDGERKRHDMPTPLLGGVPMYAALLFVVGAALLWTDHLTIGEITRAHYLGIAAGGLVLVAGGALDDKFSLPPKVTILFPVIAALLAIGGVLK